MLRRQGSLSFRVVQGPDITEEILRATSNLFSKSYGIWADGVAAPLKPGSRVRLSPKMLRAQGVADFANGVLAMCYANDILVGHAFARVWQFNNDTESICWVTQLVVSSDYREQGIATMLIRMLPGPGLSCSAIGLVSSHPAACLALANSANVKMPQLDVAYIKEHARQILESTPIAYLRGARLHGSLFEGAGTTSGVVSSADTGFFVDHTEPMEALRRWRANHSVVWPLGELQEGHEFFIVVPCMS
ncbi:hypothetical protein C8Q76DRAFT_665870 [Earliella scabrosa]|nr:hypothetical protein C8Q76DRAFT_665870 [Earliella scabrosa]